MSKPMIGVTLSNVPLATANTLAYGMMVLVAIFLVFGPSVTYYLWKKNRRAKAAATGASSQPSGS